MSFSNFHNVLLTERAFARDCEDVCKEFVNFCKDHLNIHDRVKIKFLTEYNPNITTGCYDPSTREIQILTKDRGLIDVLRSIAHELVHQKQHLNGELHERSGENGSDHENEAHAKAGLIMRLFQAENKDKIY